MIGGIVGYGAYIPRYRISLREISSASNVDPKRMENLMAIEEKSVPGKDEDAITIAVHAGKNALLRSNIDESKIGCVYVGSESHPYAVKPSATVVGEALGIGNNYMAADMEFACKGGTAALQAGLGVVASGMCDYALSIGSDTAQADPKDILSFTAGVGGAAFVLGNDASLCCVTIEKTISMSSETPDFWRRAHQKYPEHAGRFTAEPSYFHHITETTKAILDATNMRNQDFDFVVFHQPNGKFPVSVAKRLGFVEQQYEQGMLVKNIGNCYSASSLLGLTAVLDHSKPNQKILLVSYGGGGGSDAFVMTTTDLIIEKQKMATMTRQYVAQKTGLTYRQYRSHVELIY